MHVTSINPIHSCPCIKIYIQRYHSISVTFFENFQESKEKNWLVPLLRFFSLRSSFAASLAPLEINRIKKSLIAFFSSFFFPSISLQSATFCGSFLKSKKKIAKIWLLNTKPFLLDVVEKQDDDKRRLNFQCYFGILIPLSRTVIHGFLCVAHFTLWWIMRW